MKIITKECNDVIIDYEEAINKFYNNKKIILESYSRTRSKYFLLCKSGLKYSFISLKYNGSSYNGKFDTIEEILEEIFKFHKNDTSLFLLDNNKELAALLMEEE